MTTNLPDIDWKTNTISSHQYPKKLNEDFLNIFDKAKLTQVVHFNTRKNACLDLLLTNRPTFVDNCLPQPGFGNHDTSILADILCHPQKIKPTQRTIPCWNRADIDSLKEAIKSGMNDLVTSELAQTPVNELWLKLKNIITDTQQQYVPTKTTFKRSNQPWFNHECKHEVRKKVRRYLNSNVPTFQRTG